MTFLEKRLRVAESSLGKILLQQAKGLPCNPDKIEYYQNQIKQIKEQLDGKE